MQLSETSSPPPPPHPCRNLPSCPSTLKLSSRTVHSEYCNQILSQCTHQEVDGRMGTQGQNVLGQMSTGDPSAVFPIRSEQGNKSPQLLCKMAVDSRVRHGDTNSPFRHPHVNYHTEIPPWKDHFLRRKASKHRTARGCHITKLIPELHGPSEMHRHKTHPMQPNSQNTL